MQLTIDAPRSFVWGYSDTPLSITTPDAFIIAPGTIAGAPWNPRVGIRDRTPAGVLEINAISTAANYLSVTKTSSSAGGIFLIRNNGYIGVQRPTPTVTVPYHSMQFGNAGNAALTGDGVWTNASSRKQKENIQPLSSRDAEQTLDELHPVTFHYQATPQEQNAGFIAEDVPELVAMKDRKSLSTMDIVAVLTKTVQDQQGYLKKQRETMKEIRQHIRELKRVLDE